VPQNPLDDLVVYARIVKIGGQSAAEGVPAVPVKQGIVPLENVALGLVILFRLPAD